LFSRPDGSPSLIGLNFSNSVSDETIKRCDRIRAAPGLTRRVRFEHHITETAKSVVRNPPLRSDELVELARDTYPASRPRTRAANPTSRSAACIPVVASSLLHGVRSR
jgi:hypothetical protein